MSKDDAQKLAIERAVDLLKRFGVVERCTMHGFGVEDGTVPFRVFGMDMHLDVETLELTTNGESAKAADHILLLHYLGCDVPVVESGERISFRELTGGQFYWEPFKARTVNPLAGKIGNDLEALKSNLSKFDWEPVDLGDFGAKVHAFGNLYVTIVWHLGDDEFPAAADILFDRCIKRVFEAEDAVVMASRICIGCLF